MFSLNSFWMIVAMGATSISTLNGQSWHLTQKLVAEQPDPLDFAGISVDISDSLLVMGAWWDDNNETGPGINSSGAAHVFRLTSNGTWSLVRKLSSSAPEQLGYFGFSVAVEGNLIAIGAYNEDHIAGTLNNTGAVYIYQLMPEGSVQEMDKLIAPDAGQSDYFGYSISLSGDRILIGAYEHKWDVNQQNEMDGAGAAYIFQRQNDQWSFQQKLVASDRNAEDNFAKFLDISGDRIVIGAEDHDQGFAFDAGSAYIFEYDATQGIWEEVQQIFASDAASFKDFGWGVAITGDHILIGASSEVNRPDGSTGSNTGAVYAFQRNSRGIWQQIQKIFAPDYNQNDFFGRSIDIQDGYCVIGSDMDDEDVDGNSPVSGAGSAYIFRWENAQWIFEEKIIGTDREVNDFFGGAVALSWPYIAVGANSADLDLNGNKIIDAGASFIFLNEEDIISPTTEFSRMDIQIAPNPSSSNLQIICGDRVPDKITLHTASGIFITELNQDQNNFKLGHLPPAHYFIRIQFDGQWGVFPWTKH